MSVVVEPRDEEEGGRTADHRRTWDCADPCSRPRGSGTPRACLVGGKSWGVSLWDIRWSSLAFSCFALGSPSFPVDRFCLLPLACSAKYARRSAVRYRHLVKESERNEQVKRMASKGVTRRVFLTLALSLHRISRAHTNSTPPPFLQKLPQPLDRERRTRLVELVLQRRRSRPINDAIILH